jgi:hypothetical protein
MALDVAIEPMTDWKKEAEKYRDIADNFAVDALLSAGVVRGADGWVVAASSTAMQAAHYLVERGLAEKHERFDWFKIKCRDCG